MFTAKTVIALGCAVLALAACDKGRLDPARPRVEAGPAVAAAPTGAGRDSSVPAADSVATPAANVASKVDPGTRSNAGLTRAEESSAMPVSGQSNSHSAPLSPATRASSP